MTKESHLNKNGLVPNKEGTGTLQVSHKVDKNHFIVLVHADKHDQLMQLRSNKDVGTVDPYEYMESEDIYEGHIGMHASNVQLENAYNTADKKMIAQQILLNGKFH